MSSVVGTDRALLDSGLERSGFVMSATPTMPAVSMAQKAGWGTRALAILIDVIGVGIIAGAVSSILGGGPSSTQYQGLSTLFQAAYFTYFWSAAVKGQTLASLALSVRVVKP